MTSADIKIEYEIPKVFKPLFSGKARYRATYGGRGSGKSHAMAALSVLKAAQGQGVHGICVRKTQKSLKYSSKLLIEDMIQRLGLGGHFEILRDEIRTPGGGKISFIGLQAHTAESLKSFEGTDWLWAEEAQTISARSLEILCSTIRKPGSELYFSWNPRSASDPVDNFFRGLTPPPDTILINANYGDNPFFPDVLEKERLYDKKNNPERYPHVWEGFYEPMAIGAVLRR